ncbi:hypothetical protein RJP21_04980 [Paenibacillus sp. VCA1]|uniref:hypothetical protein n=1 Tax=Paenibacillus sp. VCA1 TaxID=3039148 RepID=UPI0028717F59|nr:hypothetical protein [Paenibacillus sp. VCA1]MDR9852953.1 hypothetical protein [Paenibacillus sp. VCA1]
MHTNLTPDLIRDKALTVLVKHANGIKQADFFAEVEAVLSTEFVVHKHSVKNALWDLSDRFPEYVVKKKFTYRDVRLFPSSKLLVERNGATEDYTKDLLKYMLSDEFKAIKLHMLALKVKDIERHLFLSEIEGLINEIIYEGANIHVRELEEIVGLKVAIKALSEQINQVTKILKGRGIEGDAIDTD